MGSGNLDAKWLFSQANIVVPISEESGIMMYWDARDAEHGTGIYDHEDSFVWQFGSVLVANKSISSWI